MHFGEYELSPSLISLSPLPTAHPKTFQRQRFGPPLVLPASPWPWVDHSGFASAPTDYRPIQTRFRFGSDLRRLNLAS